MPTFGGSPRLIGRTALVLAGTVLALAACSSPAATTSAARPATETPEASATSLSSSAEPSASSTLKPGAVVPATLGEHGRQCETFARAPDPWVMTVCMYVSGVVKGGAFEAVSTFDGSNMPQGTTLDAKSDVDPGLTKNYANSLNPDDQWEARVNGNTFRAYWDCDGDVSRVRLKTWVTVRDGSETVIGQSLINTLRLDLRQVCGQTS